MMRFDGNFPVLYPILDASYLTGSVDRAGFLRRLVLELAEAGVGILQYRNKTGSEAEILADARVMREALFPMSQNREPSAGSGQAMEHPAQGSVNPRLKGETLRQAQGRLWGTRHPAQSLLLILNDWPELAVEAGFDGAHVGQMDMSPAEARRILGPEKILGFSTHNEAQLRSAEPEPVNYIAIGPVYATRTKENPDPVVGLDGVRRARSLTRKPLVAIGGITAENAGAVLEAGADSVAVISGIFAPGGDTAKLARSFLEAAGPGHGKIQPVQ
jgi:thiamine-phosphate pyrophosphorylase